MFVISEDRPHYEGYYDDMRRESRSVPVAVVNTEEEVKRFLAAARTFGYSIYNYNVTPLEHNQNYVAVLNGKPYKMFTSLEFANKWLQNKKRDYAIVPVSELDIDTSEIYLEDFIRFS
jgi:hypothetical protein